MPFIKLLSNVNRAETASLKLKCENHQMKPHSASIFTHVRIISKPKGSQTPSIPWKFGVEYVLTVIELANFNIVSNMSYIYVCT